MFVCSPALNQVPVKSTQSCDGREEGSGCSEDCFKELVLLEVPGRDETSKLKNRGERCWVRSSSRGRVSAEQSRGPQVAVVPEVCWWCHTAPR